MSPMPVVLALCVMFGAQSSLATFLASPTAARSCALTAHRGSSYLGSTFCRHQAAVMRDASHARMAMELESLTPGAGRTKRARATPRNSWPTKGHLAPGPVLLSWATGLTTLALQATLTDGVQLDRDAAVLFGGLADPAAQRVALYSLLWSIGHGWTFFLMKETFPALQSEPDATGVQRALEVPHRRANMPQHPLGPIDYSYVALNSLCMPGLFYHFICLMREWGLDLADPPLFGIYPPSVVQMLTETLPHGAFALATYFAVYEFGYYWWHRAMHEVPALYVWVHKHHHQQTYPDRAALDTLNTGCVESQLGLYMQLATLCACDHFLGVRDLPAAIWFFTIAGYLSVLEHDRLERALPFDLFRTDGHHMHHAHVRCNYSPYSTLWDRAFGTHKDFEVVGAAREPGSQPEGCGTEGSAADAGNKTGEPQAAPTTTRTVATNRAVSDRIWAEHHQQMGSSLVVDQPSQDLLLSPRYSGRAIGYSLDADDDGGGIDSGEIDGEVMALTRGAAYSVACGVNAVVFLAFVAVSLHWPTALA